MRASTIERNRPGRCHSNVFTPRLRGTYGYRVCPVCDGFIMVDAPPMPEVFAERHNPAHGKATT